MPKLSFRFTRLAKNPEKDALGRHSIVRPIVDVRLYAGPGRYIDTSALLDTGADETLFDHELAEAVGIEWDAGDSHEIQGIGGSVLTVHFKDAAYEIAGYRFQAPIGFTRMPAMFKAVLGQLGFFDRVMVAFDQPKGRFELVF